MMTITFLIGFLFLFNFSFLLLFVSFFSFFFSSFPPNRCGGVLSVCQCPGEFWGRGKWGGKEKKRKRWWDSEGRVQGRAGYIVMYNP